MCGDVTNLPERIRYAIRLFSAQPPGNKCRAAAGARSIPLPRARHLRRRREQSGAAAGPPRRETAKAQRRGHHRLPCPLLLQRCPQAAPGRQSGTPPRAPGTPALPAGRPRPDQRDSSSGPGNPGPARGPVGAPRPCRAKRGALAPPRGQRRSGGSSPERELRALAARGPGAGLAPSAPPRQRERTAPALPCFSAAVKSAVKRGCCLG